MKLHDQTPFLITRSHQDIPVYQYNLRCITFHYQVKSPSRFIKKKETKKELATKAKSEILIYGQKQTSHLKWQLNEPDLNVASDGGTEQLCHIGIQCLTGSSCMCRQLPKS